MPISSIVLSVDFALAKNVVKQLTAAPVAATSLPRISMSIFDKDITISTYDNDDCLQLIAYNNYKVESKTHVECSGRANDPNRACNEFGIHIYDGLTCMTKDNVMQMVCPGIVYVYNGGNYLRRANVIPDMKPSTTFSI